MFRSIATRSIRPYHRPLSTRASQILDTLDFPAASGGVIHGVYDGQWYGSGDPLPSVCPTTGEVLGHVSTATPAETQQVLANAREAYKFFRSIPAPKRGEILRQIRQAIAEKRDQLGALVSLEMGKIRTEGEGEVQEIVDICDYGVGLSRMMNGRVVASERKAHNILEVANPLGVVAVLTSFNFPVAPLGWNFAISLVAGNATVWKPSPTTPLCAVALTSIISRVLEANGVPGSVAALVSGGNQTGELIVSNRDVDLVSFTGSERVGRIVGTTVMSRFGKSLLELGGNNATIVMPDADLEKASQAVLFSAIGTAGQRCTSARRLYLHRSIHDEFLDALQKRYSRVVPGDPLARETFYGPLHTPGAVDGYLNAVSRLKSSGAEILCGGSKYEGVGLDGGNFVKPTIALPKLGDDIWKTEIFAPILNVAAFDDLGEAIEWNNSVPQGLSSSLWTRDLRHVGRWIGPSGSDCGIVNVNTGTSGAEIGAAFGGNKSTGWGRESGGDAWKAYVRWSACTVNFSDELPLAQGVSFDA